MCFANGARLFGKELEPRLFRPKRLLNEMRPNRPPAPTNHGPKLISPSNTCLSHSHTKAQVLQMAELPSSSSTYSYALVSAWTRLPKLNILAGFKGLGHFKGAISLRHLSVSQSYTRHPEVCHSEIAPFFQHGSESPAKRNTPKPPYFRLNLLTQSHTQTHTEHCVMHQASV